MGRGWLIAVSIALGNVGILGAQPVPPPASVMPAPLSITPAAPVVPVAPSISAQGQPPLLLPVPQQPDPPLAVVPRPEPQGIEYDPGYQYLPEQIPDRRLGDAVCGPPGRWWVTPSMELSWVPTQSAPTNIHLPIPNPASPGRVLGGLRLPTAGLATNGFAAALGLSAGHWFGEDNTHGVEASFFIRDANTTFYGTARNLLVSFPNGTDRSAPVIIPLPNAHILTAFPVTLGSFFTTADVNYRHKLYCSENGRLDALVGYRYAFLGDELYLGDLPTGGHDDYRLNRAAVSNNFNGGELGLAGEYRVNRWYVLGAAKLAFGGTTTEVATTGLFTNAEGRVRGGFRRLSALTGSDQTEFAVLPAFNVQFGRQVSKHTRIFAGYSFSYLSRVGRLGDAINPLNTGLNFTDFWVQSISLGADIRF